jgi:hypothetical protein
MKDILKGSIPGILVGVAATLAAPVVLAVLAAAGRPVLKAAIKTYLDVTDRAKEVVSDAREQWSDVVAEARTEHVEHAPETPSKKVIMKREPKEAPAT